MVQHFTEFFQPRSSANQETLNTPAKQGSSANQETLNTPAKQGSSANQETLNTPAKIIGIVRKWMRL